MPRTVFVTGATGYIAKHIVLKLLQRGDAVIGSARSTERDAEMRAALAPHLADESALDRYRTVALDLASDDGWNEALAGADSLMHTASPFPISQPRNEDDVIRPAVDGTLRALRAAQAAGIRDVVLTSSSVAIMSPAKEKPRYDESDWTDTSGADVSPYAKSKTLAERAAWDFVENDAPDMRLAVINPTFVQGAPLDRNYGTSIEVIERLVRGKDPMLPRLGFACCDVEDVAEAHLRALDLDAAKGGRHIIYDRFLWFEEFAQLLKDNVEGAKPATRVAPKFVLRALALFDPSIRSILPEIGKRSEADNTRMREVLGLEPRDVRNSIVEAGRFVVAAG